MDDLIPRAAAVRALASSNGDYLDALERLEKIPAVGAVPVIRCRDCKHSIENVKHLDMACERSYDPDFYCAAGERKDSE